MEPQNLNIGLLKLPPGSEPNFFVIEGRIGNNALQRTSPRVGGRQLFKRMSRKENNTSILR